MPKLLKLFCVGFISVLISILSSSIYAKQGDNQSNQGKGNAMHRAGNPGKGHKHAKTKKNGNHRYKKSMPAAAGSASTMRFSGKDRDIINNYYSSHPYNTTGLPPGIAMNLARGKQLPPGIAKTYLPNDLTGLLGARPDYEYLVVGRDVILVNRSNQIIVDILNNILR